MQFSWSLALLWTVAALAAPSPQPLDPAIPKGLLKCTDLVHAANSTGVTATSCYMPAVEALAERELNSPEPLPGDLWPRSADAVSGPYCETRGLGPIKADATHLCGLVPSSLDLPPAYSSVSCRCESYSLQTAVFRICNCDYCSGANTIGNQNICAKINKECVQVGPKKWGYSKVARPNTYWILHRNDDNSEAPPLYSNC